MRGRASARAICELGAEVGHREILAEPRDQLGKSIPAFAVATGALNVEVSRARRELAKKNGSVLTHRTQAARTRRRTR